MKAPLCPRGIVQVAETGPRTAGDNHSKGCRTSQKRQPSNTLDARPRLLADAMLGRLSRWLRLMGYDTSYAATLSDHQIAAHARAKERVVLTRDRELARRRGIRSLLIRSQKLEEQIQQVFAALGPPPPNTRPRCPKCNTILAQVTPDEIRARVPAYVLKTHQHFCHCTDCDQVYWQGSHWRQVQEVVERLLDQEKHNES